MDSMDQAPEPRESPLRKLVPLMSVGILLAAIYAGYTVYSRHADAVNAQKAAVEKQLEQEKQVNSGILQHGELTIITFGAADRVVHAGQTTELCYGVVNAKAVKLDPPLEASKPSYRHCIEIAPKKTTTYTLTATGDAGQTKTSSITVEVP